MIFAREENNNYINFGYGFVTDENIIENPYNADAKRYPIHKTSYLVPMNRPISLMPYLLYPDEVFTFISEYMLPNNLNRYIVSNYGRIFDLFLNKFVPIRFSYSEDGVYDRSRCHLSHLIDINTLKSEDILAHRIILGSFCYNPDYMFLEVDHINGIYTDNRLCNLEWVTPEENKRRARELNLSAEGGEKTLDEISAYDADMICKLHNQNISIYDISMKLNIKRNVVKNILCGCFFCEIVANNNIYNCLVTPLNEQGVRTLCELISSGMPISDISSMTGISKEQILDIIKRRSYVNISKEYNFMNANLEFRKTLTEQEVDEICRRLSLGEAPSSIARELEVSESIVTNIKSGKVYTNISKNFGEFERLNRDRLPDEIVHNICLDLQNGAHNVDIMKKYNLVNSTVSRIRSGELYPQISCNYTLPKSEDLDKRRELSDEIVHKICQLLAEGKTPTETAEIVGIEVAKVNGIKSGTCYRDISSQYIFPRLTNLISDDQVKIVCTGLQEGWRLKDIIEKSKMSKRTIYRIRDRERYTEISKDYNW